MPTVNVFLIKSDYTVAPRCYYFSSAHIHVARKDLEYTAFPKYVYRLLAVA